MTANQVTEWVREEGEHEYINLSSAAVYDGNDSLWLPTSQPLKQMALMVRLPQEVSLTDMQAILAECEKQYGVDSSTGYIDDGVFCVHRQETEEERTSRLEKVEAIRGKEKSKHLSSAIFDIRRIIKRHDPALSAADKVRLEATITSLEERVARL
jgi:hypothetical protein